MSVTLKLMPSLRIINRFNQGAYMSIVVSLLRRSGVRVEGSPLWISPIAQFDISQAGAITIGDRVVISNSVQLLTHDFSLDRVAEGLGELPAHLELVRCAPVVIGDRAFIGMNAMIMPGVTIGSGAIVGAGSVVTRSVDPETVVAGNPARVVSTTAELWHKRRADFEIRKRRP